MKTSMLYCVAEAISQSKWLWLRERTRHLSDIELYDQASRGPWGSFVMVSRVRWRSISALGALVTIHSLAIDAFTQQVIHFETEQVVANGKAAAQVQWYYRHSNVSLIPEENAVYSTVTWGSSFGDLDTAYACSTGNCTWDAYQSLGACHACADITAHVQIDEACFHTQDALCSIFLPSGPTLAIELGNYYPRNFKGWWYNSTTMMNKTAGGDLLNITGIGLSILNFTRVDLVNDEDKLEKLFENFGCHFGDVADHPAPRSQCLEKLRHLIRASAFTEKLLNAWWNDPAPDPINISEFLPSTYQLSRQRPIASISEPVSLDDLLDSEERTQQYLVEAESHKSLSRSLSPLFDTSMSYQNLEETSLFRTDRGIPLMTINDHILASEQSSAVASTLAFRTYGSQPTFDGVDRVPETFGAIATAPTQSLRQSIFAFLDGPVVQIATGNAKFDTQPFKNVSASGTAFNDVTVVRVRWGWLVYPINLLLMTIILTSWTKVVTTRQGIPAWRSSTMALMVYGPYSHFSGSLQNLRTTAQMELRAKRTKISLVSTDRSWKLSEVSQDIELMKEKPGNVGCQLRESPEDLEAQQPISSTALRTATVSTLRNRAYDVAPTASRAARSRSI
ncbi:MAG: hypothetical protein Q9222_005472 [Ikaeria aurantiellina]